MQFDDNSSPTFTDDERAEIATEHEGIAADLWKRHNEAQSKGLNTTARRLWSAANDAQDVADAARISSAALARIH